MNTYNSVWQKIDCFWYKRGNPHLSPYIDLLHSCLILSRTGNIFLAQVLIFWLEFHGLFHMCTISCINHYSHFQMISFKYLHLVAHMVKFTSCSLHIQVNLTMCAIKYKHSNILYFSVIWIRKYSIGWEPSIGACWLETALPKYIKLEPVFFANKWLSTCVKPSPK